MRAGWASLAPVVLLAAAALVRARPPPPRGLDAPVSEFSAERAMEAVRVLAAEPHPAGSPAGERVRGVVAERLRAAGLEVEVLRSTVPARGLLRELGNVVARRRGAASTGTVLLVAHHDSVPFGPGAADDAASVAAILESLRALREGPALRNDLLVLVSDGEELGLLGAAEFAKDPARLADVRVVLNFEARGNAGPTLMFETSTPNGRLVAAYGAVAPRPGANSLMAAVYRRMPNDTDFTVFRRAGLAGLNFAFLEGYDAYHTADDTPVNLSLASLEHQGETMLAVLRRFGDADLREPAGEDLVYFDVLGAGLVRYPMRLAWIGSAGALLLLAFALRLAGRAGLVRAGATLAGAGLTLVATAVACAAAYGAGRLVLAVFADRVVGPAKGTPHDPWVYGAIAAVTVVVTALARRALGRRAGAEDAVAGALLLWVLLLLATTVAFPEATFLFVVPLLAGAGALAVRASGPPTAARLLVAGTLSGLGALVVVPMLPRFYAAMTLERPYVATALLALFLGTLPPWRAAPAAREGRAGDV